MQQVPSYAGHIVFACLVFMFCNCLCGLIALALAGGYAFAVTSSSFIILSLVKTRT